MSTATTTLAWSPELVLGDPRTDATHQEFIDLLNATAHSDAADKLPQFQALLAHTVAHFAQEERWMLATGISNEHCHFSQHSSVLEVMREVERRALAGEIDFVDQMLEALVEWFPTHAKTMDDGLVAYLQGLGYDTATETIKDGSQACAPAPGSASLSCGH